MIQTAAQMIAQVQSDRYPWLTPASGLRYINQINKELLMRIPAFRKHGDSAPQTIATVVGTGEYDLNAGGTIANEFILQIEQVQYTVGGSTTKLYPTSTEELDRRNLTGDVAQSWHADAPGVPKYFYIIPRLGGVYIGLHPKPSAIGSLKIWGAAQKDLASGDSLLYLPTDEVYVEGISYRFAKAEQLMADAAGYSVAYEDEINKLIKWVLVASEGLQSEGTQNAAQQ